MDILSSSECIELIEREKEHHREIRGQSGLGEDWEAGFMKGLEQARLTIVLAEQALEYQDL